jgi:hypothetical protein
MSNFKTEIRALWLLLKFFGSVVGLMALTWIFLVVAWAVFE